VTARHLPFEGERSLATRDAVASNVASAHIISLDTVKSRAVRWLWRGYLPLGKLVTLDGFPGQGKSSLLFDIAARLSRGAVMPDGSNGIREPSGTLVLSYEDDAADTILPRLIAARGDPSKVHVLAGVRYNGDDVPVPATLPRDIAVLDDVLTERPSFRLVVIDPLMAAVGADVDSHKDQDIRRPLSRLRMLAEKHNVCIVTVRHVKKSPGTNAITAGGGSIGIIGQARVGLILDRHPDDEEMSVLAVTKSNVSALAPSLMFRKVGHSFRDEATGDVIETSVIEWEGRASMTADELLSARDDAPLEQARDDAQWLRDVLAAGPVERKELLRMAKDQGIEERRLERLAKRIRAIKKRTGQGRDHVSHWSLPTSPATPDKHPRAGGSDGSDGSAEVKPETRSAKVHY
jgi:hypothetical protein